MNRVTCSTVIVTGTSLITPVNFFVVQISNQIQTIYNEGEKRCPEKFLSLEPLETPVLE